MQAVLLILVLLVTGAVPASAQWAFDQEKDPMTDLETEFAVYGGTTNASLFETCRERTKGKWDYYGGLLLPRPLFARRGEGKIKYRLNDGEILEQDVFFTPGLALVKGDDVIEWTGRVRSSSRIAIETVDDNEKRFVAVFDLSKADLNSKIAHLNFQVRCLKRASES